MSLKLTGITQWNVGAVLVVCEQFVLVPVRVLISIKFKYMYFMTSLWGENEVQVKFEKSRHNYNISSLTLHIGMSVQ